MLSRFTLTHAARKAVGVGSVGTRVWILLLEASDGEEPLFLQAKEAQVSVCPTMSVEASIAIKASESWPVST